MFAQSRECAANHATSFLVCSFDCLLFQKTTPHNSLYVLHWMPQSHTWQPLSMCCQNSVRGWLENSLHQERTHAEWLLGFLPHAGMKRFLDHMRQKAWVLVECVTEVFQYQLCSTYRELWRLADCPVVIAQWQSNGWTSQVSWVQFLTTAGLFTFF